MKKSHLSTPAALVDLDVLEKNISTMAESARNSGIKLRPHVKTHKMPVIAKMQLQAGAAGITCAKASEAEVMARSGIRDMLIAFPVVGEIQIGMIMKLLDSCRVTVGFDSFSGAAGINDAAGRYGLTVDLCMIVDTGAGRDGVAPGPEALELAGRVSGLNNVRIRGIMTHEGHVYRAGGPGDAAGLAWEAGRKMVETARLLRSNGHAVEEVSMGSTPACRAGVVVEGITEWRPGTYVFNDMHEVALATPLEECALSILGTVVSNPAPGRYILDTGSKTLAADKIVDGGYGYIKEAPGAVIERISEEHGVVRAEGEDNLLIGRRVEIIPNHACTVINLMDWVYVCRGEEVVDRWRVEARGKTV